MPLRKKEPALHQNDYPHSLLGLHAHALIVAAALAVTCQSGVVACDTPVFRFAMYSPRWTPSPYGVFYVHHGEGEKASANPVNERLQSAARAPSGTPNVHFEMVDVADAGAAEQLPPALRQLGERGLGRKPFYAIVNPRGELVYHGDLSEADLEALLHSPVRRELSRLMTAGNIVLLLLEGKEAKENETAEETMREVIRLAGEGRLDAIARAKQLDAVDSAPPKSGSPGPPAAAVDQSPRVAMLKVSRDDAREAWLVRMLMRADQELDELADRPMVFPIYGRARALPPCIGAGITKENLLSDGFGLGFLAGPCSCEVKDGNPGTDLLTAIDWSAVGTKMAKIYGDEDSADLLTDVTRLVPRPDTIADAGAKGRGSNNADTDKPSMADLNPPADTSSSDQPSDAATAASAEIAAEGSAGFESLRTVGILVACMVLAAVLGTLLLLRPRGS
jgi:hypothetical protein